MILKIYGSIWALGLVLAAVLYFTGNLTPIMHVVFGFLSFGAIFMGLLAVLPATEFHGPTENH
jgi:zinc transporter ZupT